MMIGLAPVALVPDLAAALAAPLARDPDGSRMGRFGVTAADPDVAMAVPAVIAGNPYPPAMWGCRNNLPRTRRGWPNTNHDLRRGGCSQDDGSGGSEKTSLQVHSSLLKTAGVLRAELRKNVAWRAARRRQKYPERGTRDQTGAPRRGIVLGQRSASEVPILNGLPG
jgi:hypothetical protein